MGVGIVVITGRGAHHKHFAVELAKRHRVLGVIHPLPRRKSFVHKLAQARRELAGAGVAQSALRLAARAPEPIAGWRSRSEYAEAEADAFPTATAEYDKLDAALIHHVADVNADDTVRLIERLGPDAVVCLGGPIYSSALIESCPLMLNFHTGLSPLYNGASTIDFAFANGHVHLCAGTLMTMSTVVDGGDVLAHYLPAIDAGETPATLMMKCVEGAVEAYGRFLEHLDGGAAFARCAQSPPLFYCRSRDWTIAHARRVRFHIDDETARSFERSARLHEYWREESDAAARARLQATVSGLLGLA